MPHNLLWVETLGGPHLLSPIEALASWQGAKGWRGNDPNDTSDYGRACQAATEGVSLIASPPWDLVVLGGDVGPIAWFPYSDGKYGGVFAQVLASDSDEDVIAVVRNRTTNLASVRAAADFVDFSTGPSGVLVLIDAVKSGVERGSECLTLTVSRGRYRLNAYYVETEESMIVLRELDRTSD